MVTKPGPVVAALQARMASNRLPGKAFASLFATKTAIDNCVDRVLQATRIDEIVVATSSHCNDDVIAEWARERGLRVVRGSHNDVVSRLVDVLIATDASHLCRVTADCPLIDPVLIDAVVELHLRESAAFTCNYLPPTFPDGLDVAVLTRETLLAVDNLASNPHDREHVTTLIERSSGSWNFRNLAADGDFSGHRWTLDNEADLKFLQELGRRIGPDIILMDWLSILQSIEELGISDASGNYARNYGHH